MECSDVTNVANLFDVTKLMSLWWGAINTVADMKWYAPEKPNLLEQAMFELLPIPEEPM